jgi:hypothetical protein
MKPIDITHQITGCFIKDLAGSIDPRLLLTLEGYSRARNICRLATCSSLFDAAKHGVAEFRALRQVEAFVKKASFLADDEVCLQAARTSFLENELVCAYTNRRLDTFFRDGLDESQDSIPKKIRKAQRYIKRVLGSYPQFVDDLPSMMRVTSGATSTRSRRQSLPYLKMTIKPVCTPAAWPFVDALYSFIGIDRYRAELVHTNRVEFVPKNWKTHRTIACEPESNLYFQLAFDKWTKKRLKLFGQDLSNQSRNQRLACQGSIDGSLATVDFSAASDTVAYNTVVLLFPDDWLRYLDSFRASSYKADGLPLGTYEKFSSMGNGSTFCIETLIFASLAYACGSSQFSVYGDDVIIESELYEDYVDLSHYLGFHVNLEKSYSSGPFRESCGGDFYEGVNVTPFYIRSIASKAELCHVINGVAGVSLPRGHVWSYLRYLVRTYDLPLAPPSENSMNGIQIPAHDCYRLKVLRYNRRSHQTQDQSVWYKSYLAKGKTITIADLRTLFLWYVSKAASVTQPRPWLQQWNHSLDVVENLGSTSVPAFKHGYVRKWVRWYPPATGTPGHAYAWSDYLIRES